MMTGLGTSVEIIGQTCMPSNVFNSGTCQGVTSVRNMPCQSHDIDIGCRGGLMRGETCAEVPRRYGHARSTTGTNEVSLKSTTMYSKMRSRSNTQSPTKSPFYNHLESFHAKSQGQSKRKAHLPAFSSGLRRYGIVTMQTTRCPRLSGPVSQTIPCEIHITP